MPADLGLVIQFLKRAFASKDINQLAHDLLEHLASLGLNSSVLITADDGQQFVNLQGEDDLIDVEFIKRHRNDGRLVDSGDSVLINHEHISLLVNSMPDDEDRRGRVRDSMQTLMEGVESRILGIMSEQKAEEARRARDEFYAIMSHELRTPLNPIIGFSSILMRKLQGVLPKRTSKA